MRVVLPSAAKIRKLPNAIGDADGRRYAQVSPHDARELSLAPGRLWYWCANARSGPPPQVGMRVRYRVICRIALGFERTRAVGVVELR